MPEGKIEDTTGPPLTAPHSVPIFDTGAHPAPPAGDATAAWSLDDLDDLDVEPPDPNAAAAGADGAEPPAAGDSAQPRSVAATSATSVVVPGQYHCLSWWKLALLLIAVWVPAAGIGLGLFSWWYSLLDKTPAVFVVLVYVVVCTVTAVILAMVVDKPLVSALAIGLLSAVFISALAAAPLYGHYFCQHALRCVAGIIPY